MSALSLMNERDKEGKMAKALQSAAQLSTREVHEKRGSREKTDVGANLAPVQVDMTLKNGIVVRVLNGDKPGATSGSRAGLGKITNVKGSLAKLIEMIATTDVPSDTLEAMLNEVTESATRRQPRGGGLTKAHADVLVRSGAVTPDRLVALEKRVASGELAGIVRETRLGAITRTLTAEQVGERLGGISASRVRHRQNDNHLYAFLAGKSRRYPLWQFIGDTDRVVPKLSEVVPHFIDGWQPASVEGFMTTPQRDLPSGLEGAVGDEAWMTPVEWLASGGDPAAIIAILDRIART